MIYSEDGGEYGLVANVAKKDPVFRPGAKLWLIQGSGAETGEWTGLSKGGRRISKWAPYNRMTNYRVKWVPEHLREKVWCCSREYMEQMAAILNSYT